MRSRILRMDFAHCFRHVGIQSSYEWNTRRTTHPCRSDSSNRYAQHQGKWSNDPTHIDLVRHVAYALHDALQDADIVFSDCHQQRQRRTNVESTGDNTSPDNSTGQSFLRLADFVTHYRSKLQPHEPETNHPKRIQHELRICGDAEFCCRYCSPEV